MTIRPEEAPDIKTTVTDTAGPFSITSQNSPITYTAGTSQTVTWDVAGTTSHGIDTPQVDILWSDDQ